MRSHFYALLFLAVFTPFFASAAICPTLSRGSTGASVSAVQKILYDSYQGFPSPTGYFGPITEAAVKQWQGEHGIEAIGIVGPKTAAAMKLNLCSTAASASPTISNPTNNSSSVASLIQALLAQVKILQEKLAALLAASTTTFVATTTVPVLTYEWQTGGWSTCANVLQSRTVSCVSSRGAAVADSYCTAAKPTLSQACVAGVIIQPCTFNSQTIAHGESITAYQSSSVPVSNQCLSQSRTCTNGALSGSYQYTSCRIAGPTPYTNAGNYGLSSSKTGAQNATALRAAVDAAGSGRVVIPAGSYCLSGTVSLTEGGTWLSGAGIGVTTLSSCGTNTTLVSLTNVGEMLTGLSLIGKQGGSLPVVTLGSSCIDCFIESLDISGGSQGIRNEAGEIHFYDISLHNPASAAIYSTGNIFMSNILIDTHTYAPYAIQFDTGALEEHLHNVRVTGPFGHAFALTGGRASFTCSQCSSSGTTGSAAYFASGRGAIIIDSSFGPGSENGSSAIEFGSNFEGWSSILGGSAIGAAYGIYIGGGSDNIVDGVQTSGSVKGIGVAASVSNYKIDSTGRYFQPTVRNIDAAQVVAAHAPPGADAVNAADYGLAPSGSGAQNAIALTAAIGAAGSGGRVVIPKGMYCIGREVSVPAGVWLDGESYRGAALSACGVDTTLLNLTGQGTKLTNLMLIGKGANRDAGAFGASQPIVRVAASCRDCFLTHLHFTGGSHSIDNAGQHTSFFGIIGYAPFGSSIFYSTGNDTVIYRAKLDHNGAGVTPSNRAIEPWRANTTYGLGDLAKLNGFYIIALRGGVSGSIPPMLQNNPFRDGSVEWSWEAPMGSSQLEIAGGSAYGTQVDMTGQLEHAFSMTNAGGSTPSFSCLDCILSQAFDSQANLRAGGTLELSNAALGIGVVGTEGVHVAPSWGGTVRIEGGIYGGGGAPAIHLAGGTNHVVNGVVVTSDGAAGVQMDSGTDAFVSAICRGASPCVSQYVPPVVTITANPSTVPSGGRTSISWVATNATSCSYSSPTNSPTDYAYTNSAPTNGETGVGPLTSDATYTVSCGGTSKSVIVHVTNQSTVTCSMWFDPAVVAPNENATFNWTSTNADSVTFDTWNGRWPANGQIPGAHSGITGTTHGTFTGASGMATCSATLSVAQASASDPNKNLATALTALESALKALLLKFGR